MEPRVPHRAGTELKLAWVCFSPRLQILFHTSLNASFSTKICNSKANNELDRKKRELKYVDYMISSRKPCFKNTEIALSDSQKTGSKISFFRWSVHMLLSGSSILQVRLWGYLSIHIKCELLTSQRSSALLCITTMNTNQISCIKN